MTEKEAENDDKEGEKYEEPKRKIEVIHRFVKGKEGEEEPFTPPQVTQTEGEKSSIEQKLAEKEAMLALLAEKAFSNEKEAVLSGIEDEDEKAKLEAYIGDNPERLETVRMFKGIPDEDLDDGSEAVPPKGKVKKLGTQGTTPTDGERKYTNPTINMISELFSILKDPEKTEKEKAIANTKLDELYLQIAQGRKQNPNFKTIRGSITTCPSCGHALENVDIDEGGTCPYCGWKRDGAKTRKIHKDFTFNPK